MSYSLKLANPRLKWENLLDSSPFLAVGWELHVKKFPKRELLTEDRGIIFPSSIFLPRYALRHPEWFCHRGGNPRCVSHAKLVQPS